LTWGELHARSDQIAAGLHAAGVRKGDRVGLLMHNRVEFLDALFAIMKCGAATTLLNIRFTATEMTFPIIDAGIRVVLAQAELVEQLSEAARVAPDLKIYTTSSVAGCRLMSDLRVHDAPPDVSVGYDDVALVCYTSGTTGFPKGAMLTHGNIRESALACVPASGITHRDRLLVSLPMAYTWGTCQFLREGLLTGAASTIIDPASGVDRLIEVLEREHISVWSSVVVLWEKIAQHPRFGATDFSALKHAVTGAASLHLLETWRGRGVPITQAYGLTETAGHVSLLFAEDSKRKLGSAGRAVLNTALKVMSESGVEAKNGEAGEIYVKGPMVMKGYINNAEATEQTMDGGWLRTGDVGQFDDEGFLYVVDRHKDMLKSGGLNVYPAELERVLAGVPGMEEFAIIGVPDQRWGETAMIVAYGAAPLDADALRARCQRDLADYKRPHYYLDYGKPLPRTVSGKILKRALREEFPHAPERAVRLKG